MPPEPPRSDLVRALLLSALRGVRRIAMFKLQAVIILALIGVGTAGALFSCSPRARATGLAVDAFGHALAHPAARAATASHRPPPAAPAPAPASAAHETELRHKDQQIAQLAEQVQILLEAQRRAEKTQAAPHSSRAADSPTEPASDFEAQHRALADLATPALKQSFTAFYDNYFFQVQKVERFGNSVKVSMTIRNDSPDSDRQLNFVSRSRAVRTSFFDTSGDEYEAARVSLGRDEDPVHIIHRMPSGLPVKASVTFDNVPPRVSVLAVLTLGFYRRHKVDFNALPITLPKAAPDGTE